MKKRFTKRIIVLFTIMISCVFCAGMTSMAAVPRVMLSDYKLSSEKIYPGDTFKLTFTLKNTSKVAVSNIKVTVSTEDGSILPDGNAGTIYIDKIDKERESVQEISLKAGATLEEKSYKLNIKTEYEGSYSAPYEVTDSVYIPIALKQDVMISDLYIAEEEIRLGDNIEILATVNNTGASTLYNVTATVSGSNISKQQSYVGNIMPGKSGQVDIITKTTALYMKTRNDNTMVITYEDREGNRYEEKMKITSGGEEGTINVQEVNYADIIEVKKDDRDPNRGKKIGYILIGVGAAVIIAAAVIARRRKKKQILDEF